MKRTNNFAKYLSITAFVIIVVGVISSVIAAIVAENILIVLYGVVSSIIVYVLFNGFAEVIELLHNILACERDILKKFNDISNTENDTSSKSELKGIEDNLPEL